MLSEINQSPKDKTLYMIPHIRDIMEYIATGSRMVGRGTELVYNENRVLVGEDEKFWRWDGGDSCTTWIYLMPLKNGKNGKLYIMGILPKN